MPLQPTYQTPRNRYEIDRCEPQKSAIQSGKIRFHALTKGHYPGLAIPTKMLPGLNHIGFWDAAGRPDWGLEPHRNEGIEIMFLETGLMDFAVDQKKFPLRAGHFTVTRPWQLHKLGAPNIGPGRLHWLILDVGVRRPHQPWHWPKWLVLTREDLAGLTAKLRGSENPVWQATPAIAGCFREIARRIAAWPEPYAVSRLAAQLNLLLIGILDALAAQQTREDNELTSHQRTVEIFLRDLETGRIDAGEPWTMDKMAAHCGIGITTFAKYCRALVNAGPVEFLNRTRLENAARQLRQDPRRSITTIALANGFNSSQYFATAFRHRFQVSPGGWRRARAPKSVA